MTHLDLFSGIGGFAIAAQNCGYTTIGFCEREPYAQQILKERFGAVLADAESRNNGGKDAGSVDRSEEKGRMLKSSGRNRASRPLLHPDIFTINGADYAGVDLLTGGFPCQPFSVAGKRRGAADDRALWPQMLRVIDGAKPRWLIGENVAGIVTMELDNILSDLESIGYAAWPLVIPACSVDARHRRDRVWIVAHCNGERLERSEHERQRNGTKSRIGNASEDVADAGSAGLEGLSGNGNDGNEPGRDNAEQDRPAPCGFDYSDGCSQPGPTQDGYEYTERDGVLYGRPEETGAQWLPEPELGRVAHGIPNRAHRLRGLGNAIVPQVAEEIIRLIPKP